MVRGRRLSKSAIGFWGMGMTTAGDFASRTETRPSSGAVLLGSVELSRAERWYEDGAHVIRSTEFDCIAEHPDAEQAVAVFVDNAFDLMLALSELDAGEATEGERDTLALIESRFARAAWDEERREARRREAASRMRRRGEPHWGRHSPAGSSSLLSPA